MADGIQVEKREETGTLRMRRLRKAGNIPAVVYGHGKDPVNVQVSTRLVDKMVRDGHQVVTLAGAISETALIKDVQWDAFGSEVIHMDFVVVDANEKVEVSVSLEFKGDAKGTNMGGQVNHLAHEVVLAAPANNVPGSVVVNIEELGLGDSISAGDLELPSGSVLISDPDQSVVTCVEPSGETAAEGEGEDGTPAEPEVIGAKADDEGEAKDS